MDIERRVRIGRTPRRRGGFAVLLLAASCCPWLTAPIFTVAAQGPEPATPVPLALIISGGGTKGSYMAGHLYFMGQMARLSGRFQPRVFTGASAGAINSMVGMLTACGPPQPNPTRSLYWDAWTSIGIHELFVPEKTTATGMLTTDAYHSIVAQMRRLWQAGLPTSCDVVLGVVITRVNARNVVLAPGFPPLPLSREVVLVRITGQGPGRPPLARNEVDSTRATGQLLLPLDGPDAEPFEALQQLVIASAAFPLGFSPVSLRHCVREAGTPTAFRCTPNEAVTALFMDGGIFDNQPLGAAIAAMRILGAPHDDGRFYFLDPRVRAYPSAVDAVEADDPEPQDVVRVIFSMVDLASSTQARELIGTFEQQPWLRDRLLLARTYFPQISRTFTGLLDRGFREFDFYLGMYNAARSVREHPLGAGLPELDAIVLADGEPDLRDAWRPYQCLRAVLDGVGDPAACDGDALTDFRILLQFTLDRLTEECRSAARSGGAGAKQQAADHPQCRAAMEGVAARLVEGVRVIDDEEKIKRDGESELNYQLRLLGRYGFRFRDLGLDRHEAHQARDRVIRLASRMLQQFSDVQQPRVARPMAVLMRIGVDMGLGYLPPVHSVHLTMGQGIELGYGVRIDDRGGRWPRFGVALGFNGVLTYLSASDDFIAVIPKAGLEFEVLGKPETQIRLGARMGYQFSSGDDFTTGVCDYANEANLPCSRVVTEAYAAASILGFLRLQVAGVFEPGWRTGQSDHWALQPTVGVQFNSPF